MEFTVLNLLGSLLFLAGVIIGPWTWAAFGKSEYLTWRNVGIAFILIAFGLFIIIFSNPGFTRLH